MNRTRRTLAVLFAAAAATAATAVPARADIDPGWAPCPAGYVCVAPPAGQPVLVPEGEGREFPDGIKAAIANRTRLRYCVGGSPNFFVPPGGAVAEFREIRAVVPMAPTGGACLH